MQSCAICGAPGAHPRMTRAWRFDPWRSPRWAATRRAAAVPMCPQCWVNWDKIDGWAASDADPTPSGVWEVTDADPYDR